MNRNTHQATRVLFQTDGSVATETLSRTERKNPITFESYAEMVAILQAAVTDTKGGVPV